MPPYLINLYWMLLGIAVIGAFWAVITDTARPRHRLITPVALILLVLAGRWPTVLIPGPLNPDESLMLAQAIKFSTDWLPWRSIDPGTGGPVNSYILLTLHWLGLPIGFPLARIAALVCIGCALALGHATMSRLGGARSAGIALLPAAAFFAFGTDVDFVHYSSELASLLTISLMLFLISLLACKHEHRPFLSLLVGVAAFLVCMSKIQGLPLAAALGASALMCVSRSFTSLLRHALTALLGFVFCTSLMLVIFAFTGILDDFHASFIALPFQYASSPLDFQGMKTLIGMKEESLQYAHQWLYFAIFVAALFPLHVGLRREPLHAILRGCSAAFIGIGLFLSLTMPGRLFPHYTLYLGVALPWITYYLLPWVGNDRGTTNDALR